MNVASANCSTERKHLSLTFRLILVFIVFSCSFTTSLAVRQERLIDAWRPVNYAINITLDDRLSEIKEARAEINVVAIKTVSLIDLDFSDLTVESVRINSNSTPFEHKSGLLNIKLPEPASAGKNFSVVVSYHGKPTDGLILAADKDGKPSAIGDNWPNRVHNWIPCLDHPSAKATVTFNITAPARDLVVANGRLTNVETAASGDRRWTYSESVPIPPYCMIVAVGEFARLESAQHTVTPLIYYVPQSDSKFAAKGFAPAAPALGLFTQTVAPYPYEKLALIIGATRFGGMENSSAIVFASTLFNPNPQARISSAFGIAMGVVDVDAHEIAHQWFGDSVTESTWADLWLSEGFATYFAGLFIQRYEGEEAFQRYMKQAAETCIGYEKKNRTPIHDTETEDLFKLLNAGNYQKGAWVLHMLRSELGDEKFFRGIRIYYQAHKNSIADSEDLRAAFEKASGRDLKEFFGSWVYGTGHPRYELSWEWKANTKQLRLVLRQLQTESTFPNALPVDIITSSGKRRIVLKPTGKQTIEEVKLNKAPAGINIDPENTVLKEVSRYRQR